MQKEILSIRLIKARQLRALSQGDVAKRSGIFQSRLSKFEDAKQYWPSVLNLARIADVLDVSCDYLLGRSDDFALGRQAPALMKKWAHLDEDDRKFVLGVMNLCLKD